MLSGSGLICPEPLLCACSSCGAGPLITAKAVCRCSSSSSDPNTSVMACACDALRPAVSLVLAPAPLILLCAFCLAASSGAAGCAGPMLTCTSLPACRPDAHLTQLSKVAQIEVMFQELCTNRQPASMRVPHPLWRCSARWRPPSGRAPLLPPSGCARDADAPGCPAPRRQPVLRLDV